MNKSRLAKQYNDEIRLQLQQQLGMDNVMMVPKILKIVMNIGSRLFLSIQLFFKNG